MTKKLLMGNEAFAHAALEAGVRVVAGYPGTPSSELIETVAKLSMRPDAARGRARGMVHERESGARTAGGRGLLRRARAVHLQAGGPQRGQRRAHEPELRGREGRHRAVRGRRSRPHLVADRAGHAPVRRVRQGARARPGHARAGLRHDEGGVRSLRALSYAGHRASHDAHRPCLHVLRRGRRNRGASGAGRRLRARLHAGSSSRNGPSRRTAKSTSVCAPWRTTSRPTRPSRNSIPSSKEGCSRRRDSPPTRFRPRLRLRSRRRPRPQCRIRQDCPVRGSASWREACRRRYAREALRMVEERAGSRRLRRATVSVHAGGHALSVPRRGGCSVSWKASTRCSCWKSWTTCWKTRCWRSPERPMRPSTCAAS